MNNRVARSHEIARGVARRRAHAVRPPSDPAADPGSARPRGGRTPRVERSDGGRTIPAMPKLLLLDGHSLAYRAFYALPTDLATPDGHGHQRGVRLHVDAHEGARRREARRHRRRVRRAGAARSATTLDAEYKAGRKETPDLFASQLPLIHEVLDSARRSRMLEVDGRRGRRRDRHPRRRARRPRASTSSSSPATATRTSSSRDPHIKVLYNKRGVSDYALYDEAGIFERTGVTPAQYPEYAALRGDTSDNLPGVPGIGEKTAAKLITTYGNLEGDLRAPRRPAAEAAPEPRRVRATACSSTARCRCLRRDVDVDVEADDLAPGRVRPRAGARAVRPARVPHAAARDCSRRSATSAAERGRRPRRSTSRSRRCATPRPRRDAARRARRRRASAYALEAPVGRRGRAQPRRRRSRVADGDGTATYIDGRRARATPTVRDALERARRRRRPAARRAPRQGADARRSPSTCARCATTPR